MLNLVNDIVKNKFLPREQNMELMQETFLYSNCIWMKCKLKYNKFE